MFAFPLAVRRTLRWGRVIVLTPLVVASMTGVQATTADAATAGSTLLVAPVGQPFYTPAVPSGLVATPGDGHVSLDWKDNTDRYGHYQVYRDGVMIADDVADSAYVDKGLANGQGHEYRVSAGVIPHESAWTAPVSATPRAATPSRPTPSGASPSTPAPTGCDATAVAPRYCW